MESIIHINANDIKGKFMKQRIKADMYFANGAVGYNISEYDVRESQ
ncbi:MAG: hypothetical protein K2H59_09260 [Muribaculaceae bacterium]|nr:hypothetical protein [Muribaculaceae bacterium]